MKLLEIFNSLNNHSKKWDSYIRHYEVHLSKYVGKSPKILEIGIGGGGSLEMWSKYFGEGSEVFGVDLDPNYVYYDYGDLKISQTLGDQNNSEFWNKFISDNGNFDIIIDDGSHDNNHQITSLVSLFPYLNINGTYIVEDTHTCYCEDWGGGFRKNGTFIETAKGLIDFLHRQFINNNSPSKELNKIFFGLESIIYYNSMVVLTKNLVDDIIPIESTII